MTNDYTIGYKKPPEKTQFQKGQSGNRKGRPKGSKSLTTFIDSELKEKVILKDGSKITKMQLIAKQMVNGAVRGDVKQTGLLFKYSDTKQVGNGGLADKFMRKFIADGYVIEKDIVDYVNGYTRNIIIRKDIVIDLDIDDMEEDDGRYDYEPD